MYYFAYGSNMHHEQMRERCPDAHFLGCARLDGYVFVYDGNGPTREGAVANITPSTGSYVEGGLWEIRSTDLLELDRYEDFPRAYKRLGDFSVTNKAGRKYDGVIIYFRTGQAVGNPSAGYREVVLQGAGDCGLSEEYIHAHIR